MLQRRRRWVPAAGLAAGAAVRTARRPFSIVAVGFAPASVWILSGNTPLLWLWSVQAAHLVHLHVLPLRDGGAEGGGGAHQGAAARHHLVHIQDTLLDKQSEDGLWAIANKGQRMDSLHRTRGFGAD